MSPMMSRMLSFSWIQMAIRSPQRLPIITKPNQPHRLLQPRAHYHSQVPNLKRVIMGHRISLPKRLPLTTQARLLPRQFLHLRSQALRQPPVQMDLALALVSPIPHTMPTTAASPGIKWQKTFRKSMGTRSSDCTAPTVTRYQTC